MCLRWRRPHQRRSLRPRRQFCVAPYAGWLTVHARRHQGEVSPVSRGVMSQPLSDPLQAGLRLFPRPLPAAPSARLAVRFPLSLGIRSGEGNRLTTFRRCTRVAQVASLRRWLTICARGVRGLWTWPRTFWSKRDSSLRLFSCDDACDASPGLTFTTPSWFPTALLLAVAVTARAWAALLAEEATLSRGLLSR